MTGSPAAWLMASMVFAGVGARTGTPGAETDRAGRCFTPVEVTGVYFEVTADSATERVLRAVRDAEAAGGVVRRAGHSHVLLSAVSHVRVPTTDQLQLAQDYPQLDGRRLGRPTIHALAVRGHESAPSLLVPTRVSPARSGATHHERLVGFAAGDAPGDALDVVIRTDSGTTGCRLKFR